MKNNKGILPPEERRIKGLRDGGIVSEILGAIAMFAALVFFGIARSGLTRDIIEKHALTVGEEELKRILEGVGIAAAVIGYVIIIAGIITLILAGVLKKRLAAKTAVVTVTKEAENAGAGKEEAVIRGEEAGKEGKDAGGRDLPS